MKNYTTPQEDFWANDFGTDYIARNNAKQLLISKIAMFSDILRRTNGISSAVEFGCNIGINLIALKSLIPDIRIQAIEINPTAAEIARSNIPDAVISTGSIFDYQPDVCCDLAFTCGVMIHLNPELLPSVYDKLAALSKKYTVIAEYYNPSPVALPYRGHTDKLFKRDFAEEFMVRHPKFQLVDYRFVYRKDPTFPLDDLTWFLFKNGH